jgi:X-X-X-Leu-X-X-Gly heptad repeat protein
MPRKIWSLAIASVLVSVILLYSQVVATDADGRKKIAVFLDRTPLDMQQQAVVLSKSTVVRTLLFINVLAIELPDVGTAEALAFLLNYTVLRVYIVVGVYDDPVFSILPITPALPPPQQTYNWGLEHIRVEDAHEKMPTMTGVGVQVAMLDTGVGPHADLPTLVDGSNTLSGGVPELYSDDHGHATHITGIIAARANNDVGLISAAPRARLVWETRVRACGERTGP